MDTRKIIDYAQDGNAVGVRESLYASIWDRVHAAIEAKKQEIAQNLVAQESYEGPGDDEEEDDWDEEDEHPYNEINEISTRTLARAASRASDPEADMMYDKPHDPQKFAAHAAKRKDAKSAAAVQGAADAKGHFPRPHHSMGYDDMEDRENRSTKPSMVTKAGKLTKSAQSGLKSQLKLSRESYHDDDEDPDVRIADKELKKRGVTLPKVKVDPDKDMAKLAKRTPKEKEED
jgi:hypothetical protein